MEQETALEKLKSGRNVFLTGEPGSGKTYTINTFTEWLDNEHISYAVTASTGIAASHINGTTIHSWSGIGIMKNLEQTDIDGIRFNKFHYPRIKEAEVIILDEVSMLEATFIDDLDKVLKAVHRNELAFGGIQVVMVGDFFQLPPVSREGAARFAFESEAWRNADFLICYLTEQHRQADPIFTGLLRAMRFNELTKEQREILSSCIKKGKSETNLFTHNQDVDTLNGQKLTELPGEIHKFKMEGYGSTFDLATLKRNCLSPEILSLKKNAVIMFTANNPKKGYVNGSTGIVIDFVGGEPKIQLYDGSIVYPEKNSWKLYDEKKNVKAEIKQYPLRLAWAITVHKSQGMSLDSATIDLSKAFEYGHGYVAVSRIRSLEGLFLAGINESAFKVNPKVLEQDKVFREIGA